MLRVPKQGETFPFLLFQHMFKLVNVLRFSVPSKWKNLGLGILNETTVR